MIVYPLKRISKAIVMNLNPEWGVGRSDNGWMTSGLYYESISNIFYPWLLRNNIKLPVVLFVDGHRSHITYHVSQFCKDHGIHHIALTPNATHILQPADVSVFKPLKVRWQDVVYDWKIANPNKSVTREMFGNLLEHAFADEVTEDIVKNGFKRCGLYPFDANAVEYSKCMSTRHEIALPTEERTGGMNWTTLKCIEGMLKPGRFVQFILAKASGNQWKGDREAGELFEMWSKLKDHVRSETEPDAEIDKEAEPQPGPSTSSIIEEEPISPGEPQPGPSTPFADNINWPEGDGFLYHGERFPLATTSKKWMSYHDKKEAEKMEKEERKRKRAAAPRKAPAKKGRK